MFLIYYKPLLMLFNHSSVTAKCGQKATNSLDSVSTDKVLMNNRKK